jgi:transcriptional regulator
MYIPNHFRQDDRDKLVAFMRANSFAILVTSPDGAPFATHLPLVVDVIDGRIVLKGHVAKANPQWKSFVATETVTDTPHPQPLPLGEGGETSLVIFHGPHAYVSPANYENPQSVPTWNYIAVHAYGMPRIVETKEALLAELIAQYEPAHQQQWDSQTEKYKHGMLTGIVAFEIDVARLEGKYKLSQNRPEGDQRRVAEALSRNDDPAAVATAQAMMERRK